MASNTCVNIYKYYNNNLVRCSSKWNGEREKKNACIENWNWNWVQQLNDDYNVEWTLLNGLCPISWIVYKCEKSTRIGPAETIYHQNYKYILQTIFGTSVGEKFSNDVINMKQSFCLRVKIVKWRQYDAHLSFRLKYLVISTPTCSHWTEIHWHSM